MEPKMTNKKRLTVCLAGNPNSGKTTIFNNLTGARQKVGNYPGVTVEKVEGRCLHKGYKLRIVDLPGTYSLTARSLDEEVARNFIIEEKPDVIIHIIDGTSLERSLYLTTQLAELDVPIVAAINMSDALEKDGTMPDLHKLQHAFGIEFIPTVGHRKRGMEEMLDAALSASDRGQQMPLDLGPHLEQFRSHVPGMLEKHADAVSPFRPNWLATKLLEGERSLLDKTKLPEDVKKQVLEAVGSFKEKLEEETGKECINYIAEQRYEYIKKGLEKGFRRSRGYRLSASDKIDKIVINRFLGLPIFGLIMFLVFYLSVDMASPLIDAVDGIFSNLAGWITKTHGTRSAPGFTGRRCDRRCGRGDGICPADHDPLFLYHPAGGVRLYGPGLLCCRQADEQNRAARELLHTHAARIRLYGSGDHGLPYPGQPQGSSDHNAGLHLYELRCPLPGIPPDHRGAFFQKHRVLRHLCHLPAGGGRCHSHGQDFPQVCV